MANANKCTVVIMTLLTLTAQLFMCDKQVQAFIALGPVVTVGHIQGFARYLSDAVVEEKVNITIMSSRSSSNSSIIFIPLPTRSVNGGILLYNRNFLSPPNVQGRLTDRQSL